MDLKNDMTQEGSKSKQSSDLLLSLNKNETIRQIDNNQLYDTID